MLAKKLSKFSSFPESLNDSKFKSNEWEYLEEGISKYSSMQPYLLSLTRFAGRIQRKSRIETSENCILWWLKDNNNVLVVVNSNSDQEAVIVNNIIERPPELGDSHLILR